MENVQRAMGELRVTNGDGPADIKEGLNGRRGKGPIIRAGDITIPTSEFDFAKANARFDKTALGSSHTNSEEDITNPSDTESKSQATKEPSTPTDKAYNPKASFFDSLGSGSQKSEKEQVTRGGRGGRGRRGSSRREEERQRNVATFGEPGGGPGLMGPGAYVPGWGGSGRRGQGRGGRRGVPRPVQ
jgi:protein LSM14